MKLVIPKGTTSKRVAIFIQDSSSTTGAGLPGLVFNSAGLSWYYWREDEGNAGATAVTLATATRGTFASGGFVEKDATNMPGFYELGIPDAALATGAEWVVMELKGATNMAPLTLEIQLSDPVRGLGAPTALPGVAAEGLGGLYTRGTGAGQINQTANGQIDVNVVALSGDSAAADNAETAFDGGAYNVGGGAVVAASVTGAVGSVTGAVGSVAGNVGGNVSGSVGSIAAGGITAASFAAGAIDSSALAASALSSIGGAVWDVTLASHVSAGSTGFALNAAGSAGDPWATSLPGAYGAGTAGFIVGTNVDATISSRLASASYTAPPSASANADAVWDEARAGHVAAGSFGEGVASVQGSVTGNVVGSVGSIAAGGITAASFAAGAINAAAIAADALVAVANGVLGYDMASVTGAASRSLLNAIRFLRNKWSISGTTLTVTAEDDTTAAWTATLTTNASAEPITSSDPA